MIYITTDNNSIVASIKEASVDPVESKKLAKKKMSEDKVLLGLVNEISRLERLLLQAKVATKLQSQIKTKRDECNKIISKHIANNIAYTNPVVSKGMKIELLDAPIGDASSFLSKKTKYQLVKFVDGEFRYIDDFTNAEFWERADSGWIKQSIDEIGVAPHDGWINKADLTIDQLQEIKLINESDENKNKRLRKEAFAAFLDRLFEESDEYSNLNNSK